MLALHTKRHIRYATVTRGSTTFIIACVVEMVGNETRIVSAPKIVKIIQNKNTELPAGKKIILALPAPISHAFSVQAPVASPFFSILFGKNSEFLMSLAARPPTK